MERHAKIYQFILTFLFLFFVSVEAGGVCSKCRQPQIAPAPPIVPRLDLRVVMSYPIGDGTVRKKRLKRHAKIAVQQALNNHLDAEIRMHQPQEPQ